MMILCFVPKCFYLFHLINKQDAYFLPLKPKNNLLFVTITHCNSVFAFHKAANALSLITKAAYTDCQ